MKNSILTSFKSKVHPLFFKNLFYSGILVILIIGTLLSSCAPTKEIADKSGAQLWGENCNRCHNSPTIDQYSKQQWTIIVPAHMKLQAGLTNAEVNKIVNFLKQSKYPW